MAVAKNTFEFDRIDYVFKIINKNKVSLRNNVVNLHKVMLKVPERMRGKKEWERRPKHRKY